MGVSKPAGSLVESARVNKMHWMIGKDIRFSIVTQSQGRELLFTDDSLDNK